MVVKVEQKAKKKYWLLHRKLPLSLANDVTQVKCIALNLFPFVSVLVLIRFSLVGH